MKPLLLSCIVLLAIGCKKSHNITIADLKFADYEKEFIAKNGVDSIYHIMDKIYFGNQDSDTVAYEVFDKNGNRLYINNTVGWGNRIRNKYDSLGFKTEEIFSSDYTVKYYVQYRFVADSLKLYQDSYYLDRDDKKHFFTPFYYQFDSTYRIIKYIQFREKNDPKPAEEIYSYDSKGRLVKVIGEVIGGPSDSLTYEKNIYYTGNKPDSVITNHRGPGKYHNYTTKTYYNSAGLKYIEVDADTMITRFKYIFRK